MDCPNSALLTRSSRLLFAMAASSAMIITGCSSMSTMSTDAGPLSSSATVSGKIHGGNQAVSGAKVRIRFAGQVGLGKPNPSPYDVVATSVSASDGSGSFSFVKDPVNGASHPSTENTFSCPAASVADPFVYVEAVGGNTLNDGNAAESNSAAVFLAPLGLCTSISSSSFVNLSEVTTVATMAALSQYFDPTTGAIGSDGIGLATTAMGNSFNLAAQLVDLTKGVARPSFTLNGSATGASFGVGALTVTATPEVNKLNQIANIVSSCINTTSAGSTACTTLFANAAPANPAVTGRPYGTTFPAATDVRQALYYMFTNPTNGSSASLKNLYDLAPAAGAPYQPSLTSMPTDWTVAVSYSSNGSCGTTPSGFINSPSDISVDYFGNVWFSNAGSSNLSALTSTGSPYACVSTGGPAKAGGVVDSPNPTKAEFVWTAGSPTGLIRYDEAGHTSTTFATPGQVLALAVDGSENVYFATANSLYLLANGSTAASSATPLQISNSVGTPSRIVIDSSSPGAIWSASGSTSISRTVAASAGPALLNGYSTSSFTTAGPAYGIAVSPYVGSGATNNVFVSSGAPANSVTQFTGSGTSYAPVNGWPTVGNFAGLNNPTSIVLDGVSNAWVPNFLPDSTSTLSSISEISIGKAALSPTGFQKAASYLGAGRASIVDQSGNVWVVGDGSSSVTEILGAAVPVCQPASYCLPAKRFQLIP